VSPQLVQCAEHGIQERAFVCRHTMESIDDRVPRGLHLWRDEAGINGWCDACDVVVLAGKKADFNVVGLCQACFELVQKMNGGGVFDQ